MAELDAALRVERRQVRWTGAQTRAQFKAIAWLRWRIFANAFRRKGGTGELIGIIITYPLAACLALVPIGLAGFFGWYFTDQGTLAKLALVLWGTFGLSQFLNIQLGQAGTTFDPTQLIRFPLSASQYVAIRLFFGLLTPGNIIITLMSLAVAVGVSLAEPRLWLYALVAMSVFAVTNILFTRMVFAWVDRWLSTRRAREVFTAFIFLFSLGIQYANVNFNPGFKPHHSRHHHVDEDDEPMSPEEAMKAAKVQARVARFQHVEQVLHPYLAALPPGLAANAVIEAEQHRGLWFVSNVGGCAAFGLLFLTIFSVRTRTEYRGEAFSDQANAVAAPVATSKAALTLSSLPSGALAEKKNYFGISPTVAALMGKEFLTMRRNTGLIYGLVAPMFLVFIMAAKFSLRGGGDYVLPGALAYSLMGIAPMAYNSFGLEGAGVQFYFMAPVRLRDVFLAKNLMNILLGAVEVLAIFAIISKIAGPPSLEVSVGSILWAVATLLTSMTLGNRRSITTPKKIDLGRTASKQASPLSALISIGVLLLFAAFGAGILILGSWYHIMWILPPVMGVLAAAAVVVYNRDLKRMDAFTLAHRDELFEELCKK